MRDGNIVTTNNMLGLSPPSFAEMKLVIAMKIVALTRPSFTNGSVATTVNEVYANTTVHKRKGNHHELNRSRMENAASR